jgi:hypothetical protein
MKRLNERGFRQKITEIATLYHKLHYSQIDPALLEHLAIRAQEEFEIAYNMRFPDNAVSMKWHKLPPKSKVLWRIVAATVINECANIVANGIREKDQR